jgi:hypothetical protein
VPIFFFRKKETKNGRFLLYISHPKNWRAQKITPSQLRCSVTPCRLSQNQRFCSEDLTAIKRKFPAENPQILLRRTSDNRDVMSNNFFGLKVE